MLTHFSKQALGGKINKEATRRGMMKKYRIRKGSIMESLLPALVLLMVVLVTGLGNHFIDGI